MNLCGAILIIFSTLATVNAKAEDSVVMPKLSVTNTAILSGSKSDNSANNYRLYLSSYSVNNDEPELVLTHNDQYYVEVKSGQSDSTQSFFRDLGEIKTEDLSSDEILHPSVITNSNNDFSNVMWLQAHHTYVLMLGTTVARGIVVFRVEAINNSEVILSYVVKKYEVIEKINISPTISKIFDLNYHLNSIFC